MHSAQSFLANAALLLASCGGARATAKVPDSETNSDIASAPSTTSIVHGEFIDDYSIRYKIGNDEWFQRPKSRFRITKWNHEEMYLIAQNHPDNPGEGGLWTRIDWVLLPDMPDYPWAFCLSAYDALSAEEAEATHVDRDHPRNGCKGFPFSRMQVLPPRVSSEQ